MPQPQITVGSITILSLSDGSMAAAPPNVWPQVPAEQWEPYREFLSPDGTLPFNLGSFLIHEGDAWTLVDTGFGNRPDTRGGGLAAELERAEVSPDQISRVVITHLHGDHIGGNTIDVDGKPVRPSRTLATSSSAPTGRTTRSQIARAPACRSSSVLIQSRKQACWI